MVIQQKHFGLINGLKKTVIKSETCPFTLKGLVWGIFIEATEAEGIKYFKSVIKKSGHSTYRIFLSENISDEMFNQFWKPLENIGCSYEKSFNKFYSIDVPSETDIHQTYSLLENGEKNKVWEFEEADVGHKLK